MKYIVFILVLLTTNSYSQLSIQDLASIKIGEATIDSKKDFEKMINATGDLRKNDHFSSVYRYDFEKAQFNNCENVNYEFLYANGILSDLKIEMEYMYPKKEFASSKFLQSLEALLSDFNEINSPFILQGKYSNLSFKKVTQKVNQIDSFFNLKDFRAKNIYDGTNVYFKKNNSDKFVRMDISIYPSYLSNNVGNNQKVIVLNMQLHLTTEKFQNYYEKFRYGSWPYINEKKTISLSNLNGVYHLPVNLNKVMSLDFILDLGASDVSITPDVFLVLYRAGTIDEPDFIGTETYKFADGSTAKSSVFNLKNIKIGDIELKNVRASISNNINSPLLLGQSALKKLPSYKIDNQNNKLIVE